MLLGCLGGVMDDHIGEDRFGTPDRLDLGITGESTVQAKLRIDEEHDCNL